MNRENISNEITIKTNTSKVRHFVMLFTALFAFWFLLSGRTEIKFLVLGLLTALVAAWITQPLLRIPSSDNKSYIYAFDFPYGRYAIFWVWLIKEIIKANIDILKIILSPKMPINPQMIEFKKTMKNPIAHVTLGNSITLTPGTVTVEIEDGVYIIHALTDEAAEALLPQKGEGEMQARVGYVFGEEETGKRGEGQG